MAKVVLTTKVNPSYDDLPERQYHFPKTYLRQIEQAVGDWVIYYEPRRTSGDQPGGRQSYFAIARLLRIEPDQKLPGHFYAFVDSYLEFDHPVPFKIGEQYFESILQREDGETNKGAFGRSVRLVPDEQFQAILDAGFKKALAEEQTTISPIDHPLAVKRRIVEKVVSRPFRDAAFAVAVKDAYNNTCAMSGLKIFNANGRPEVQAAHIQPVAKDGPDSLRNGLALTSTIHWMFDEGLVSIADDYTILVSEHRLPETALRLLNPNRRLILPERKDSRPHMHYLNFHREYIFKH